MDLTGLKHIAANANALTINRAAVGMLAVAVPGVDVVPRAAQQVPRQR